MLQTLHLKTYRYSCSRLGETVPVDTFAAYYTESLDEYPLDAKIPFASTSRNMFCGGMNRCGILTVKGDGTNQHDWHLCPALTVLRDRMSLPEADANDKSSLEVGVLR